jgi:hypothetical protein
MRSVVLGDESVGNVAGGGWWEDAGWVRVVKRVN